MSGPHTEGPAPRRTPEAIYDEIRAVELDCPPYPDLDSDRSALREYAAAELARRERLAELWRELVVAATTTGAPGWACAAVGYAAAAAAEAVGVWRLVAVLDDDDAPTGGAS